MPTLSLSVIVGPGEAFELERLMKSIQGPLFDEIVVTLTSKDPEVEEVAKKYATKTPFFEWCEDFAAARNFSQSHCTRQYLMWLDADDVIKDDDYTKLLALKKELEQHEVVYLKYIYSHDENGNPATVLPRERIFPNNGKFTWQHAIHEAVYPEGRVSRFDDRIAIHHYQKPGKKNMERNLRILEREWNKPDRSARMAFYYARDLLDSGNWAKGEPVGVECVEKNIVFGEERAGLCRALAANYHNKASDDKAPVEARERLRSLAERYALIGIQSYHLFAELWAYLGCVYYDRHDEDKAILYFETALGCLREANIGSHSVFYSLIPARNLYMIYYYRGEYSKALMYNKMILEADPQDAQAKQNRDLTWKQLFNKYPAPTIPGLNETPGILTQECRPGADRVGIPAGGLSVAWLIPWLNLDDPATRIRRVNVSNKLEQMGVDSTVVHGYHNQPIEATLKEIRDSAICVFTQFSAKDLELMAAVKKVGKRVILDSCEAIFGIPGQREAWDLADKVVCCSTKLADLHREKGMENVAVIRDAIEVGA